MDTQRRNALVQQHLAVAAHHARKMHNHCTISGAGQHTYDDLYQVAVIGLIESAEKFDESKGQFAPFASARVKGAIFDYLRREDYLSRSHRKGVNEGTEREIGKLSLDCKGSIAPYIVDNHHGITFTPEETDEIERITTGLNPSEKLALILYYIEGLDMPKIGKVIGVCGSRVSQILTSVRNRLKQQLAA